MKGRIVAFVAGLLSVSFVVWAQYAPPQAIFGQRANSTTVWDPIELDTNGAVPVTQSTLTAGEDQTNGVQKTEQRFSVCIDDADIVCNAAPGFLHSVWCYPEDAAATAGTVRVTNTTAAGGAETTEVWGMDFAAAAMLPVHAVLDIEMTTGIVIDFTTTADVKCGVSYRDNG